MIRSVCCLLAVALLAACSDPPPQNAGATADAAAAAVFRVRSDMDARLDADGGWAAGTGVAAVVTADAPFRLRMELEKRQGTQRYGLQYRRNGSDWAAVEAHDFPYLLRELELGFSATGVGAAPEGWRVASGSAQELSVQEAEPDSWLQLQAADTELIALYSPPWLLDDGFTPAEWASVFQLGRRYWMPEMATSKSNGRS